MLTLGIESSCDDTAAAVLHDNNQILSSIISSQDSIHSPFGGVVPELASRNHLEFIQIIVDKALAEADKNIKDIDLIAVTQGPGLIGSLLIGFSYAKALSRVTGIPFVGVDHMAGHLLSIFLEACKPQFPYIGLVVSGGTSSIYKVSSEVDFLLLGRTRDDAAGEAFDKIAKLLDLGYPGGPAVSRQAESGNAEAISFPRAWLEEGSFDFSFSGLKTSVLNHCHREKQANKNLAVHNICASFQEAVVEVLVTKSIKAAKEQKISTVVLGGGVSANPRLRTCITERCAAENIAVFLPQPAFCTDNGAMIAMAGYSYFNKFGPSAYDSDVYSRSVLG